MLRKLTSAIRICVLRKIFPLEEEALEQDIIAITLGVNLKPDIGHAEPGNMTREYRITAKDFVESTEEDCVLPPDDPLHALKAVTAFDGLGAQARLDDLRSKNFVSTVVGSNKGQIQREQNIKPGTPEWFQLWFGK